MVGLPLNSFFEGAGRFVGWLGLAAGALALFAIVRGERAVLVWVALIPGLFVLGFELGELLFPP